MDEKVIVALVSVYGYILRRMKNKDAKRIVKKANVNPWRLAAKLDICEESIKR